MPHLPGLGSRLLPAQLHRTGLMLRAEVQRHSLEMTTGRSANPSQRLKGDLGLLSAIEARMSRVGAQERTFAWQGERAAAAQAALGQLATIHGTLRAATLANAMGEPDGAVLGRLGQTGRQALTDMVAILGRGLAGQSLFSGDLQDRAPLAGAEAIVAAASAAVAGATTADEVLLRVRDFFDDPAGPFQTALYTGGAPVAPALPPGAGPVPDLPTAADPALRRTMEGAVLAALAGDVVTFPDLEMRRGIATRAVEQQAAGAVALTSLRGSLGTVEEALSEGRARLLAERDALETARDGRIGIDPFEAASRLEEARARLEALFVVTARVSRLSLTEYLR
jgi:flagellar hook-associated protein 3 FlgL